VRSAIQKRFEAAAVETCVSVSLTWVCADKKLSQVTRCFVQNHGGIQSETEFFDPRLCSLRRDDASIVDDWRLLWFHSQEEAKYCSGVSLGQQGHESLAYSDFSDSNVSLPRIKVLLNL
jgi:hypothetical protein